MTGSSSVSKWRMTPSLKTNGQASNRTKRWLPECSRIHRQKGEWARGRLLPVVPGVLCTHLQAQENGVGLGVWGWDSRQTVQIGILSWAINQESLGFWNPCQCWQVGQLWGQEVLSSWKQTCPLMGNPQVESALRFTMYYSHSKFCPGVKSDYPVP